MREAQVVEFNKNNVKGFYNQKLKDTINSLGIMKTPVELDIKNINFDVIEFICNVDLCSLMIYEDTNILTEALSIIFNENPKEDFTLFSITNRNNTGVIFNVSLSYVMNQMYSIDVDLENDRVTSERTEDHYRFNITPIQKLYVFVAMEVSSKEERVFLYSAYNDEEAINKFNKEKYELTRTGLVYNIVKSFIYKKKRIHTILKFGTIIKDECLSDYGVDFNGEIIFKTRFKESAFHVKDYMIEEMWKNKKYDAFYDKEREIVLVYDLVELYRTNELSLPNKDCEMIIDQLNCHINKMFGFNRNLYLYDLEVLHDMYFKIDGLKEVISIYDNNEELLVCELISDDVRYDISMLMYCGNMRYRNEVMKLVLEQLSHIKNQVAIEIRKQKKRQEQPEVKYGVYCEIIQHFDTNHDEINAHAYNYGAVYSVPEFKMPEDGKPFYGWSGITL